MPGSNLRLPRPTVEFLKDLSRACCEVFHEDVFLGSCTRSV